MPAMFQVNNSLSIKYLWPNTLRKILLSENLAKHAAIKKSWPYKYVYFSCSFCGYYAFDIFVTFLMHLKLKNMWPVL